MLSLFTVVCVCVIHDDTMYRFHIFTPVYKQFDARWCVVNLQINNKLT